MSSEVGFVPLRDLSVRITKGTTPTKGEGFVAQGVNYIKSESITSDGSIDASKFAFIDAETHDKLARSKLRAGNVLFSMAGVYLGKSAVVLPEHLPANTNQAVGIVTLDESKADPYFIHYSLQSPACRAWVLRSAAQSAQPNFNLQEIGDLKIPAFPLALQKEVAGVLRMLDDRITLLRETNATLEAIAQALFKSWFVDFDPVRAKAEGRQPEGMDAPTAALFPDSFEESELGLVPKGWSCGALSDLSDLNPESWTAKTQPATVAYIDLANAKENVIAEITCYRFDDAPSRARRVLRDGDTIIGTVRPGNRSFAFIANATENLTGSTGFAVLRPKSIENTEFVYLAATSDANIEHLTHVADGGAYPAVRPDVVAGLATIVPPAQILVSFHEIVKPLFASLAENHVQAQTLTQLRDTLLPRLISGQLRLPEAEATVEEVL